jgi:hypothetical protein
MIPIPAPMRVTEGGKPFTDLAWIYEVKYDGYRCMAGVGLGETAPPTYYSDSQKALMFCRGRRRPARAAGPRPPGSRCFPRRPARATRCP